jgi:hypothetical protein
VKAVRLSAELEADVRAGIDEAERGETVALTAGELEHWAETGELPEHVEEWAGIDRSSSPRTT